MLALIFSVIAQLKFYPQPVKPYHPIVNNFIISEFIAVSLQMNVLQHVHISGIELLTPVLYNSICALLLAVPPPCAPVASGLERDTPTPFPPPARLLHPTLGCYPAPSAVLPYLPPPACHPLTFPQLPGFDNHFHATLASAAPDITR
jgi:hypothetical protein